MPAPIPFRKSSRHRATIGRYWPQQRSRRRSRGDGRAIGLALALAALIGWNLAAWDRPESPPVMLSWGQTTVGPTTDALSAQFSICGGGARYTCVVDGDTFWLNGEKIRIADIDTPEISSPKCPAELDRGNLAKQRLASLLNAGPFALNAGARAQDRYGRSLYTVTRGGTSIGAALVDEGLAVWYGNGRPDWC